MYLEQDGIDAVMYALMSFSSWKSISTTLIVNLYTMSINTIVCILYTFLQSDENVDETLTYPIHHIKLLPPADIDELNRTVELDEEIHRVKGRNHRDSIIGIHGPVGSTS